MRRMRWDRKLLTIGIAAALVLALILAAVAVVTFSGIRKSAERIASRAEEGYTSLTERLGNPANVSDMYSIARRGQYPDRMKYGGFDVAFLGDMEYIGGEFLMEDINFTHELEFHLRVYDTENVYDDYDELSAYTQFGDSFSMMRDGEIYYVSYLCGREEYRFAVKCTPLTKWFIDEWGA